MRSKKRAAKTYTDEDTNSDQLQPRKRNTKPSTSQGTQPVKKYQTRKQTASNTPTPKHISKNQPNRLAPKTPTNKTTSTSQPNSASPKRTYVPQLRSSPRAVMKIFSEMSADLREEHKKILETTPFSHIFAAIIDRKVSESFITKTDKHICQIFAAFVDEKSGFNIAGKMMNLKTRDIQLILGIKSGAATIQNTKTQKQEWALYERRFKNYEKVNLPALKEEIKKVVKQTDEPGTDDEYISTTLPSHRSSEAPPIMYEPGTDVESMIPKLHDSEYYTEPCIEELTAKERAEPGFCCHVKDFVVGRYGYGSIKFLGQTDVRQLDLESIVQFNNREVIVYMDESTKPPVGQDLNKPAEITLLNVKCLDKKTGTHWTVGAKVEKYKKMLIKNSKDQGAEFVSYNPVIGEWKFSVQHF